MGRNGLHRWGVIVAAALIAAPGCCCSQGPGPLQRLFGGGKCASGESCGNDGACADSGQCAVLPPQPRFLPVPTRPVFTPWMVDMPPEVVSQAEHKTELTTKPLKKPPAEKQSAEKPPAAKPSTAKPAEAKPPIAQTAERTPPRLAPTPSAMPHESPDEKPDATNESAGPTLPDAPSPPRLPTVTRPS